MTYDLNTVQVILPGKFTVIGTSIDNPDLMRLRLAVLDTLRSYCSKPAGSYPPPGDLFTVSKPDMPVQNIIVSSRPAEVGGKTHPFKQVAWEMPYQRLAIKSEQRPSAFDCEGPQVTSIDEEYHGLRSLILNGTRSKTMYDCKHGLVGFFINDEDDISKVFSGPVGGGYTRDYLALCYKLTKVAPYLPQ
jgi:hypothetical protein